MWIHIKYLKGGEKTLQKYNDYAVTIDSPIKIESLEHSNRIDYTVMGTNEIGQKCKVYGYDEETEDYICEATIEIQG